MGNNNSKFSKPRNICIQCICYDVIDGHHFVTSLIRNCGLSSCRHHNLCQSRKLPCDITVFINIIKAILCMSLSFLQWWNPLVSEEVLEREDAGNTALPTFMVRRCQILSEFLWFTIAGRCGPEVLGKILTLLQIKISSSRRALRLRMRNIIEKWDEMKLQSAKLRPGVSWPSSRQNLVNVEVSVMQSMIGFVGPSDTIRQNSDNWYLSFLHFKTELDRFKNEK